MDIHDARALIKTKSVYDIPMRVTFYARVSTESGEQLNSLDNQVAYYKNLISNNPNWTYCDGYIDEGLSGISTKKRKDFNQMVADAENGDFDFIITKEISRFARNTLDSIQYTRKLLSDGVGVFFQNDNINTLEEDSELRLSIMSSIAQDELRKLSSRVRFGHQQAIKQSVVLGNSRIFGYVKNGGRLQIDPEEAEMVKKVFELYATDEYSMKQLEQILYEDGYRNHNGKKIMHNTLSGIISNPKYKGYYVGNKVRVVDMFTKKQKFLPPEEWVMFKDESGEIVPAIVSEELWDAANAVLTRRSDDVKSRKGICNHPNLLTGKLICTHCGLPFYRRAAKDKKGNVNSIWICSGKIKGGAASCPSFAIYEEEIKPILLDTFNETEVNVEALIDEYTEAYKELFGDKNINVQIQKAEARIDTAMKKQSKLLEYNVSGKITDADFLRMSEQCSQEIASAEEELEALRESANAQEAFGEKLALIRNTLKRAAASAGKSLIDKNFVDTYIDKIFVTPVDETTASLEIKIFTGETSSKSLDKVNLRTGHTFKNILPIRNISFTRVNRRVDSHTETYRFSVGVQI
jgi:DNA invertase Pin-like site-specific DNA recombinase